MRYFTSIAEESFRTDDEGRKLFYIGGPLSQPYLTPDSATEKRLFRKMTWYHRVFLSALILGAPFLYFRISERPWLFFVFLASVIVLESVILRLLFRSDLRTMPRSASRLPLRTFYGSMAGRHSKGSLVFGFIASLVFALVGTVISLAGGWMLAIGSTVVMFSGLCAVVYGYALRLKGTGTALGNSQ